MTTRGFYTPWLSLYQLIGFHAADNHLPLYDKFLRLHRKKLLIILYSMLP